MMMWSHSGGRGGCRLPVHLRLGATAVLAVTVASSLSLLEAQIAAEVFFVKINA
jgi:hypothetical protein